MPEATEQICAHCKRTVNRIRSRKLCGRCLLNPDIRLRYAAVPHASYRQGVGLERKGSKPLGRSHGPPTQAPPGTLAKLNVFAERAELGQSLFHPRDYQRSTR